MKLMDHKISKLVNKLRLTKIINTINSLMTNDLHSTNRIISIELTNLVPIYFLFIFVV